MSPNATSLPTVVFVPGAWHETWVFDDVRGQLQTRGYPTAAVPLVTVGNKDPETGLAQDAAAVQAQVKKLVDEGKEVVLVGHSYGGVVVSNAVQGLGRKDRAAAHKAGGVISVVYMTAFALPVGTSLFDALGRQYLPWWSFSDDEKFVTPINAIDIAYADVEPALAAKAADAIRHEPIKVMLDASGYAPWEQGFEVSYIFAESDRAIPIEAQRGMAAQFPAGSYTASLDTSHSPFLSQPVPLAGAIHGAASHALSKNATRPVCEPSNNLGENALVEEDRRQLVTVGYDAM